MYVVKQQEFPKGLGGIAIKSKIQGDARDHVNNAYLDAKSDILSCYQEEKAKKYIDSVLSNFSEHPAKEGWAIEAFTKLCFIYEQDFGDSDVDELKDIPQDKLAEFGLFALELLNETAGKMIMYNSAYKEALGKRGV